MKRKTEKSLEKLIAALLIAAIAGMLGGMPGMSRAQEGEDARLELIERYLSCINMGDWAGWADCYAQEYRADRLNYVNNSLNISLCSGVLTVSSVRLLDIEQINGYIPLESRLMLEAYNCGEYACFRLMLDIETRQDNDFFSTGECYKIICLVMEGADWYVASFTTCPYWLLPENTGEQNRVYGLKENQYSLLSLSFALYADGGRFTASFKLPTGGGYRVSAADADTEDCVYLREWRQAQEEWHSVYNIVNSSGRVVGAIGFTYSNHTARKLAGAFMAASDADYSTHESIQKLSSYRDLFLQEFPQSELNGLDLNSSFIEVYASRNSDACATIVSFLSRGGEGSPQGIAIISYQPELGVFTVMELDSLDFSAMEALDAAESVRIETR